MSSGYTVTCRGEYVGDRPLVRMGIVELFGVSPEEADRLLDGEGVLQCGPLPEEPARSLHARLERNGLTSYLDRGEPEEIDPGAQSVRCAACGTPRLATDGCGICPSESGANLASVDTEAAAPVTDTRAAGGAGEAEAARRALRFALGSFVALLLLTQVVDAFNARRAAWAKTPVIDPGTVMILAASALLTYATWRYARACRRPHWAGLLGLGGPVGLGVLMLWDCRDETVAAGRLSLSRSLAIGLLTLLIGVYWLFNLVTAEVRLYWLGWEASRLRQTMPVVSRVDDEPLTSGDVEAKAEAVDAHLASTWDALMDAQPGARRTQAIVDRAMGLYSRQIMWHNRLLIGRSSLEQPLPWERIEAIISRRAERFGRQWQALAERGRPPVIWRGIKDWVHLYVREDNPDGQQAAQRLANRVVDFHTAVTVNRVGDATLAERVREAAERYFDGDRYRAEVAGNRIRITVVDGPPILDGRSIVYGWLALEDPDAGASAGQATWRMVRIGGDMPDKYLGNATRALPQSIPWPSDD